MPEICSSWTILHLNVRPIEGVKWSTIQVQNLTSKCASLRNNCNRQQSCGPPVDDHLGEYCLHLSTRASRNAAKDYHSARAKNRYKLSLYLQLWLSVLSRVYAKTWKGDARSSRTALDPAHFMVNPKH